MYERRFRLELEKLPHFEPNDKRDPRVWKADFPAWRALFSSMCLFGHSTGYRLPSFEDFHRYCEHAYAKRHPEKERFAPFFKGDLRPGVTQRISTWYESGMAEAYLYACLVEAIEDKTKAGLVLYDPRADWKLKADAIVLARSRAFRISAYYGERSQRSTIEARRDAIEHERKKNTPDSAHWGNAELEAMPALAIVRTDADQQIVNGVRLFSISSINQLLQSIYCAAEVEGWFFSVAA